KKRSAKSQQLSRIDSFLSKFIDKSKRKGELIPAIRKSMQKAGVEQTSLTYLSGSEARKEFIEVIEKDLMRTGVDSDSLIGIRNLIQKNAGIEDLLKSLIDLLNNKNENIRGNVVQSFVDLVEKLILLTRMDLLKLILVAFSERLGRETNKETFIAIVKGLSAIAVKLIKEGKGLLSEQVDDILNTYLKILEDTDKLQIIITALSTIGDSGDQKAMKQLIYAINRDAAYPIINKELVKKGEKILPLLLHSMKAIEDKITRIRVLSLAIDTAKIVPNYDKYVSMYYDDPKWYVRRNIAIILGEVADKKALDILAKMAKDKNSNVRIDVMQSLGKIESEDSEILLIEGLKDQNKEAVIQALIALRKTGTPMCVFALKELIEKQTFMKKEKILEIQKRGIAVLCHIGGNDVINILRKVIFDKTILGRYKFSNEIRLLSVEGLGKMDTKVAKQILTRASWLKNQEVGKRAAEIIKRATLI
ncbi:MAG: HEAT repeat domain-containing protein, partial [Candidatus Cloacimonadota bacterium]